MLPLNSNIYYETVVVDYSQRFPHKQALIQIELLRPPGCTQRLYLLVCSCYWLFTNKFAQTSSANHRHFCMPCQTPRYYLLQFLLIIHNHAHTDKLKNSYTLLHLTLCTWRYIYWYAVFVNDPQTRLKQQFRFT